jgi:hypothetical protein
VYGENGQAVPPPASLADDAQERVIRAAEKLAAELAERLRFDDSSKSGFEDGHVARTHALAERDPAKNDSAKKDPARKDPAKNGQRAESGKPGDKSSRPLWNETFTNMPLNEVVPASEPLRGNRAPPQEPPRVVVAAPPPQRPELIRRIEPPPLSRPPERSGANTPNNPVMLMLASAGIIILLGVIVIGLYWTTQRSDPALTPAAAGPADADPLPTASSEYAAAMDRLMRARAQNDWVVASQAATLALQFKSGDAIALAYQAEARAKLAAAATRATPLSSAAPPATTPAPAPSATRDSPTPAPVAAPVAAPAKAGDATPRAAEPKPAAEPPKPAAEQPKPAGEQPKPAAGRRAEPSRASPPAEPASNDAKKKAQQKSKKLTDQQAQDMFGQAVAALKDKDARAGCELLTRVAAQAPDDSRWRDKATSLFDRRCN